METAVSSLRHDLGQPPQNWRDLSVVVPAYNEEGGLPPTLAGLLDAFPGAEIIVVDDCSTDRTAQIAENHDVRLVRHVFNQGQGASLKSGMKLATRPFVAWFDADNEHRCADLARLFQRVRSDHLVAVIGQRNSSTSVLRGVGKWLIRLVGRGLKIRAGSDLNCGLRVFRRDVILRYLSLVPDRFSASLVTTLIVVERRYPIAFEPIETNPRIGESTVRLRDGFDAILVLIRSVLLFAPMRFFLPVGCLFVLIGLIYGIVTAFIMGLGLPVASMLFITTGMLFGIMGLITDQISQLRLSQLPELALLTSAPTEKAGTDLSEDYEEVLKSES